MEKKYFSKKETAAILGVCSKTIERYLLSGKLQGARLGKSWKISEEDISTFYENAKQETANIIKIKNEADVNNGV